MRRGSPVRRFAGFLLIPIVGSLIPLLILPVISKEFGRDGWAAIAIGQSIGAAGAVLMELGWSLTGPTQIARASPVERARLLIVAQRAKTLCGLLSLPLLAAVAAVVGPGDATVKAVMAAGSAAAALSTAWYFLGTGSAVGLLLSDVLPRTGATVLAVGLIMWGAPLVAYPSLLLCVSCATALIATRIISGRLPAVSVTFSEVVGSIRAQRSAVLARGVSAGYIATPVALVGVVAPSAVPEFAAVDRVARLGLQVLQSVTNAMQSWVGQATGPASIVKRLKAAVVIHVSVGAASGMLLVLLGDWAIHLLFAGEVQPRPAMLAAGGVLVLLTMTSRSLGSLGLVRVDKVRWILYSALTGAAVGIPLIAVMTSVYGATGGLAAVAAAELAVVIVQAIGLYRNVPRPRLQ